MSFGNVKDISPTNGDSGKDDEDMSSDDMSEDEVSDEPESSEEEEIVTMNT